MNNMQISRWMISERTASRLWILFIAIAVFLCFQLIDDGLSDLRGGDDAIYLLLAKALATGHGYTDIHLPGNPSHTQYPPPLFPFLLSPFYHFFGYNFMWMRLMVIGFTLGSFFMVRRLVTRLEGVGDLPGVLTALLFITNFGVMVFSAEILPETPYIFFTLVVLVYVEGISLKKNIAPYALYLPLLVTLAYLTKSHGVALYVAVVVVLILRLFERDMDWRNGFFKLLAFGAVTSAPFVLLMLRSSLISGGPFTFRSVFFFRILQDYYNMGGWGILERVWENLGLLLVAVPGSLISFVGLQTLLPSPLYFIFSILILLTVLCGFVHSLTLRRGVMDFYVLIYLCFILIWPVYGLGDARRYMIPLVPLLYYYSFMGFNFVTSLKDIFRGFRPGPLVERGHFIIPFALFLALNIAEIGEKFMPQEAARKVSRSVGLVKSDLFTRVEEVEQNAVLREYLLKTSPCYYSYIATAFFLRDVTRPGDVIMTRKPEITALITGRYAIKFPYTTDESVMFNLIEGQGVDFVLLDGCYDETREYLIPFVERHDEKFLVWMSEGRHTGILKLKGK
jgi:4-amino-4-deoxy-L-arabinose transferase-like glycosyltransferase